MQWIDEFNIQFYQALSAQLQVDGINDVFIRFDDGLYNDSELGQGYDIGRKFINPVTGAMQDEQPKDAVWILCRHLFSATTQPTVITQSTQHKREPFSFVLTIYNPVENSMKKPYALSDTLDKVMFSFNPIVGSNYSLRRNQAVPKNTTKPIRKEQDIFQLLRLDYNFTVDSCVIM